MALSDAEIMGGVGYGYDQFSYDPIRQEPTGYSYNRNNDYENIYEYNDSGSISRHASIHNGISQESPMDRIKTDNNRISIDNSGEVENYFQEQQLKRGKTDNLKKNWTKEHLNNLLTPQGQMTFMFFALLLLFLVVAYTQHQQIQNLQNIIGYMLIKPTVLVAKKDKSSDN